MKYPLSCHSFYAPAKNVALTLAIALLAASSATADALWDSRPYVVDVAIQVEDHCLNPAESAQLRRALVEKTSLRVGLFWETAFVDGGDPPRPEVDKHFELTISLEGGAFVLGAIEHDTALGHQGPVLRVVAPTSAGLAEGAYQAILGAFRPLARVQRDPEADGRVNLSYRAERLAPTASMALAKPEELMLPFRRKRARDGSTDAAERVRWTYLLSEGPTDQAEGSTATPGARIVSHTRRPFGIRASGRVEYLAITAPSQGSTPTVLRLHAQGDDATPLPGYEVLIGKPGSADLRPMGFSNEDGRVTLPADPGVIMAHIKCGTLVVASLPVAGGRIGEIAIPLVDERSRLRAELEVTSLREELIDTVARRKILGERIRRLVAADQIDTAKRLLGQIEELPGRTQFTRRLDAAQRGAKTTHPLAQARLDRLFDKTKAVLNSALDPRETRDLSIAIDRARQDREIREPDGLTEPASQGG